MVSENKQNDGDVQHQHDYPAVPAVWKYKGNWEFCNSSFTYFITLVSLFQEKSQSLSWCIVAGEEKHFCISLKEQIKLLNEESLF